MTRWRRHPRCVRTSAGAALRRGAPTADATHAPTKARSKHPSRVRRRGAASAQSAASGGRSGRPKAPDRRQQRSGLPLRRIAIAAAAVLILLTAVAFGLWNCSAIVGYFAGTPTASRAVDTGTRPKIADRIGGTTVDDGGAPVAQKVVLYEEDPTTRRESAMSAPQFGASNWCRRRRASRPISRSAPISKFPSRISPPAGRCGVTTTRRCRPVTPWR